jgi:hypothetical protein
MAIPAGTEHSGEPHGGDSADTSSSSENSRSRQSPEEVLPGRSADDTDVGWGDRSSEYDDDWYLAERPPHHG